MQIRTFICRRHGYLSLIKEFRESSAGEFKYARRVPPTVAVVDVVVVLVGIVVVVSRNEIKVVAAKERERRGHLSVLLITTVRVLATGTFWDARALLLFLSRSGLGILCLLCPVVAASRSPTFVSSAEFRVRRHASA